MHTQPARYIRYRLTAYFWTLDVACLDQAVTQRCTVMGLSMTGNLPTMWRANAAADLCTVRPARHSCQSLNVSRIAACFGSLASLVDTAALAFSSVCARRATWINTATASGLSGCSRQ